MSGQRAGSTETNNTDVADEQNMEAEASPRTKLARRRQIEEIFEQKRLLKELGEFDLA